MSTEGNNDRDCPRPIEVALPIREISAESVRDKSLRHGPPTVKFGIAKDDEIERTEGTMQNRGNVKCSYCEQATPVANALLGERQTLRAEGKRAAFQAVYRGARP